MPTPGSFNTGIIEGDNLKKKKGQYRQYPVGEPF